MSETGLLRETPAGGNPNNPDKLNNPDNSDSPDNLNNPDNLDTDRYDRYERHDNPTIFEEDEEYY